MVGRPISFDRVLVADSDARIVAFVGQELRAAGFDVLEAFDGPSALDACMVHAPSLAIISYKMSSSTVRVAEPANLDG
jgi:DNA-binding response OmpR family regulator